MTTNSRGARAGAAGRLFAPDGRLPPRGLTRPTTGRPWPAAGWLPLLLALCLLLPPRAHGEELDWSMGVYGGQYYDSEPAGLTQGRANFLHQYIVALTASKTVWRSGDWPLALEVDGMVGHQWGLATLQEFAVAPVLRWSGFPWNDVLPTSFRFGPLGFSHTTMVSPLEKNVSGEGSRNLNFLVIELTFSGPQSRTSEVFLRLHHRCTIYDLLNNYGANGQDFLAVGYRRFFK